jgi:hypothetical protein
MNDLKPCPFCGGRAKLLCIKCPVGEFWRVYCMDVDCPVEPSINVYGRRETAIEAWNRRADNDTN